MMYRICVLLLPLLLAVSTTIAQRDDIVLTKEKKEFAFSSIKELKEGAIVVRLATKHRKIAMLEQTVRSPKLKDKQRQRHQAILDGTIKRRDDLNNAIMKQFQEEFTYCPVYVMYDTCSKALANGTTSGIFLNEEKEIDPDIILKQKHIFIVNYKKSSGEFPFDILRVRKLKEKLEEPFPYYVAIRESVINTLNTPRAERAVAQLDRRLHAFYDRALDYYQKMAERKARKAAKQKDDSMSSK